MGSSFGSNIERKGWGCGVGVPWGFYDARHRPVHFQSWAELEDVGVDRVDNFA